MAGERDREIVERYDAHAAAYQELWAPTLRLASARLVRELAGKRVRQAIDVGAGVGALWPDVRTAFPDAWVLGLDRSSGMLSLSPRDMARVLGDARALPLRAASVDLALCLFMLFHLDDPGTGIGETRRVLRPGGVLATITWASELTSVAMRIWTDCLDEHRAAPPDPAAQARHDLLDTPEKMKTLLRAGGFDAVRVWADELVSVIGLEHVIALKTRMGTEKARFDSLGAVTRAKCLARARQRLQDLGPGDFTATGRIVYAIAS